jgi:Fic family protein
MFEKKLNFDFNTTQLILQKISFIDSFKGKWEFIEKKENRYLKELKRIATIESIGSSTRIEGSSLSDPEIEKLLADLTITKFNSRDEQEVLGYYEALSIIFDNYKAIPLTENYLKQLHKILLQYSNKDTKHRGNYKTSSNTVVAKYPGGQEKIIFKTTEPYLVDKEMFELISWVNNQLKNKSLHPLIIIAIFIYEFLSIHPFQDGNGRLSRLFTTALLLQYGYLFVQYISLEHIIEKKKKEYYQALMAGQKNRYTAKEKINKWVFFFLNCLEDLIAKLNAKYDLYSNKGGYLNSRQKEIVDFIRKNQPIKISDIMDKLDSYPRNTIKKDLKYLKDEHIIDQIGRNKGAVYALVSK